MLTGVRGELQAVGLARTGVLSWVVISGGTISDYAEVKQVRKQRACEMLDTRLDRLANIRTARNPVRPSGAAVGHVADAKAILENEMWGGR